MSSQRMSQRHFVERTAVAAGSPDLQFTLIAGSLYRLLGQRIGNGYETAQEWRLFRDLVDATAQVTGREGQTERILYDTAVRTQNSSRVPAGTFCIHTRIT